MKGLILLLLISATSPSPIYNIQEQANTNNTIDQLVRQTLEYVRWLLERHEPYDFPPLPEQQLIDDDINLKFTTSNVKGSKSSDFSVDNIANDLQKLQSTFEVTFPAGHFEGNYTVSGTAFKKAVQGSGTFSVDINKFVQRGDIQFAILDRSLQLQDLKLDYHLSAAKFNVKGLNIEGLSENQIEIFLNGSFLSYLKANRVYICEKVAKHVQNFINMLMYGRSVQDVLDFLKNIVNSTPDPPPFPF